METIWSLLMWLNRANVRRAFDFFELMTPDRQCRLLALENDRSSWRPCDQICPLFATLGNTQLTQKWPKSSSTFRASLKLATLCPFSLENYVDIQKSHFVGQTLTLETSLGAFCQNWATFCIYKVTLARNLI